MLESQFTYAPVIRGTARTNARLTVRQRGNIIYSKTLTPGNFAIDDIYSGQVGADLDVTVEETDGTVQNFKVPYTALPNMIRPGAVRYSASLGEYRDDSLSSNPIVGAFSLERGFEAFTLNGSALGSDKYQSLAIGAGTQAALVRFHSMSPKRTISRTGICRTMKKKTATAAPYAFSTPNSLTPRIQGCVSSATSTALSAFWNSLSSSTAAATAEAIHLNRVTAFGINAVEAALRLTLIRACANMATCL